MCIDRQPDRLLQANDTYQRGSNGCSRRRQGSKSAHFDERRQQENNDSPKHCLNSWKNKRRERAYDCRPKGKAIRNLFKLPTIEEWSARKKTNDDRDERVQLTLY